jgi:hypothetical protein
LGKVKPDSVSEIQPGGVDSRGAAILFGWLIAVSLLKVFVPNISDGLLLPLETIGQLHVGEYRFVL